MTWSNFSSLPSVAIIGVLAVFGLTGCDSAEERASSHIDRGINYFEAAKYDRARIEFKNALQLTPANGRAYYYLGRVYEELRMWPEAIRAFGHAVDQAPALVDASIRLGRYHVLSGTLSEALQRANHVIAIAPGESVEAAEGYALRGSVELARERMDAAWEDARRALEIDPGNAAASSVLVGLYRKQNRLAEAIDVVAAALDKAPANTALRLTKVGLHLDLGQKEEAEAEAIALTKIEPGVLRHYINLAKLYIRWERLDDAEALLRDLATRRKEETGAKLTLIDFLVNQRGSKAAEQALTRFIAEAPKDELLQFALAELYFRDGNRAAAMGVLNQIVAGWPGSKEASAAQVALAGLLFADGRIEEAEHNVATVLRSDPRNPRALMISARISLRKNRVDDAIQTLRIILHDRPESAAALELLSEAYLARGQKQLAIDTLGQMVEANPAHNGARVRLARQLAENRQFESALKLLEDALERSPGDLAALATKARILIRLGRLDQAGTLAGEIERLPNGRTASLKIRGRIASAEGKYEEAITAFTSVYAAAPEDWPAIEALTSLLARSGKADQAVSVLREVLRRQPEHRRAWIQLGDLLAAREDMPGAIDAYSKAVEIDPQSIEAYSRLFLTYRQLGQERQAIEILERGAAANPSNLSIRATLALALERAGRFQDAIRVYERLREDGHRNLSVTNNLAALIADHAYEDSGRLAQAISMMEPYHDAGNALVIDTIGWLQFRAGRLPEALTFLKRAVALDPGNAVLRTHLNEAYRQAGRQAPATEHQTQTDAPARDARSQPKGDRQ